MVRDVADGPLGLRERQKRARRAALVDAAHLLVARDGLDAVTVEAICAEAGVSPRTFFNYFESKDDAVLGMEPLALDPDLAETFAAGGPTGDLASDLEALARSVLVVPVMTRDRLAAAAELARRDPRLSARLLAWMERYRVQVDALLRRRIAGDTGAPDDTSHTSETDATGRTRFAASSTTDDDGGGAAAAAGSTTGTEAAHDALVEIAGMTLMVLVRSALTRWEMSGARGEVGDHLGAARADLRLLLGGT
ncbi:TetR/AcrR family transcriptional regulator [Cellulomonas aerilata]|uniref:TetR/AcrR family transcriptional regulator n=1 Tax=Cellulomonas aerilata TaxID=515326 RepID=UPI001FE8D135|nr:TetR/AcrR family transcriptional regulator [Cellulomonas aerilata]